MQGLFPLTARDPGPHPPVTVGIFPRSISLTVQLLLAFVGLVLATTAALAFAAYRTSLENLEDEAIRDARLTAEVREQTLVELLEYRQQRATGFLAAAEALCGEPAGARGYGWSEDCVRTMLRQFQSTERASGVRLSFRGRVVDAIGPTLPGGRPVDGALVLVIDRPDGGFDFLMRAVFGEAALTLQFDSRHVLGSFAEGGLGRTQDVFLTDPHGHFLTQLSGQSAIVTPPGAVVEPHAECRVLSDERIGLDYQGIRTVHGFQTVEAIGGGCIDAHVPYDLDASRPAEALARELIDRSWVFLLIGAALSWIAAQRIARPVRRLAAAARSLQSGALDWPISPSGPYEVRELGTALGTMARELEKLVAREQAARREAESANRSKDQFLATLSHELRTPLNAIIGWTRLLRDGQLDADRTRKAIEAVERSADAQRQLIEDLLDISRIVSGQLRMVRQTVRLSEVVEAAIDTLRPRAAEKSVHLDTVVEDRSALVLGDPQRLQQVVWNLAWNGIKFTPSGGWIRVRLRVIGDQAELSVVDSGIGIKAEMLPHIFEWYRRGDRSEGAEAGLGVGLSLVRQIVELHGGTVLAASDGTDRGAAFTVRIPLQSAGVDAVTKAATVGRASTSQPLLSVRILLVDDDAETREVVSAVLQQAGADVALATSADEARSQVIRQQPDVLIADIAMPVEDGYTLVRSLRASGIQTPAVALTAFARREDAERAHAAGFQVHMPKPVDPERLVAVVASLAEEQQAI
jgi:signal transduction histidine kinase/ActR/RegA family two-component response regulator